jgi:hypothetical protein
MFSSIRMHPHSLTIRDDNAYVDAFGDTWTQFNGERSIYVGLLNVVRTSSSYSQLGWVVHFLQNFMTGSIVMLTSLPIRAAKVVIDILFAVASYCLPVCYQRDIQEHVVAKCESPWVQLSRSRLVSRELFASPIRVTIHNLCLTACVVGNAHT